ncbi:hypothetical protein MLD38_007469 [Melastoma candidum]|uniref:Uncharacterized protein n=1 Tax=Melastoma candidum TaxID=119954 RepID=A0ACB9RZT1_9MYRT|nr:hypothetical protein MLD38_007469 [Melastoma candidum]
MYMAEENVGTKWRERFIWSPARLGAVRVGESFDIVQMTEESLALMSKFDGTDFGYWKMQVTDLLMQKDMYLPL